MPIFNGILELLDPMFWAGALTVVAAMVVNAMTERARNVRYWRRERELATRYVGKLELFEPGKPDVPVLACTLKPDALRHVLGDAVHGMFDR